MLSQGIPLNDGVCDRRWGLYVYPFKYFCGLRGAQIQIILQEIKVTGTCYGYLNEVNSYEGSIKQYTQNCSHGNATFILPYIDIWTCISDLLSKHSRLGFSNVKDAVFIKVCMFLHMPFVGVLSWNFNCHADIKHRILWFNLVAGKADIYAIYRHYRSFAIFNS